MLYIHRQACLSESHIAGHLCLLRLPLQLLLPQHLLPFTDIATSCRWSAQLSPLQPDREPPSVLTLILTQKLTMKEFILFNLRLCSDSISYVRGQFQMISKYSHVLCSYFTRLTVNRSICVTTYIGLAPPFRGTA